MSTSIFDLNQNKIRESWNAEYISGQWNKLTDPIEFERFDALAALIIPFLNNSDLMDIGCGEGFLLERIPDNYRSYLGIDISDVAIKRAESKANGKTKFRCDDMEKLKMDGSFDLIIFNESLYYSIDPIEMLRKQMLLLKTHGRIICSIFRNSKSEGLVDLIKDNFNCVATNVTSNSLGDWDCLAVLKKTTEK